MGRLEENPTRGGAGAPNVEEAWGGSMATAAVPVARFLWSRLAPGPKEEAPRPENNNWAMCVGHIVSAPPAKDDRRSWVVVKC